MRKPPKSVSDFDVWLIRKIKQLKAASANNDPDETVYRDAAEIVADARLVALSLGATELAD